MSITDRGPMSERKATEGMRLPPPPREPDLDECCGSGCDPCVFDVYEERLERWRERCERLRARSAQRHGPQR